MSKKKIAELEQQINKLKTQLDKEKGIQALKCSKCKKQMKLKDLVVYDMEHYVYPFSCSGGDYWTRSETYEFECPHCAAEFRVYPNRYPSLTPSKEDQQRYDAYEFLNKNSRYLKSLESKQTPRSTW